MSADRTQVGVTDDRLGGVFRIGGDLPVHRLGFGAMRITGPGIWGEPKDPAEARKLLRRVIEMGVDLIDTADSYGPEVSERLIAEALHPYPPGLVIATKGGQVRPGPSKWHPIGQPAYLRQCVEMSLRRLKLERIDLYQLHRVDPKVPLAETIGVLREMQREGKIRHIGLSEVSVTTLQQAEKLAPIVSVQNEYNLGDRKSEAVLDYCAQHGLAFIPWAPLDSGDMLQTDSPWRQAARRHGATVPQLALAWLLHRAPVVLPIPGTSSRPHFEENVAAAQLKLSDAEWAEITGSRNAG